MTVAPGTNLVRYSGTLDNAIWTKIACFVSKLTSTDSPTFTSYRVGSTTTDQEFLILEDNIPEYQNNTVYTASMWFKEETWPANPHMFFVLRAGINGNYSSVYARFDGSNPAAGIISTLQTTDPQANPWTNVTSGIDILPNGWYRVWISGDTPPNVYNYLSVLAGADGVVPLGTSFQCGGFVLYQGTNTLYVPTQNAPEASQFYPTFLFPFHRVTTRYQNNSDQVQFGNGWTFTSKPISPPQRQFTLTLDGMRWQFDDEGNIDTVTNAANNAGALDAFYLQVQLGSRFYYNHDIYGQLIVRFFKPLELPEVLKGSLYNVLSPVTVELLELPQ
jgi:hypothetical protein